MLTNARDWGSLARQPRIIFLQHILWYVCCCCASENGEGGYGMLIFIVEGNLCPSALHRSAFHLSASYAGVSAHKSYVLEKSSRFILRTTVPGIGICLGLCLTQERFSC